MLKCMALILGFFLWLFISSLHKATLWIEVPVSFYNQQDRVITYAPETVHVQLSGYRNAIRAIDCQQLAVHIDAQELHAGKNILAIKNNHLLLPDSISVVNYCPLNGSVNTYIAKNNKQKE